MGIPGSAQVERQYRATAVILFEQDLKVFSWLAGTGETVFLLWESCGNLNEVDTTTDSQKPDDSCGARESAKCPSRLGSDWSVREPCHSRLLIVLVALAFWGDNYMCRSGL